MKYFEVCIYGYSAVARQIIDSLKKDPVLRISLVTKSVIERQRAENDGKQAIDINEIVG